MTELAVALTWVIAYAHPEPARARQLATVVSGRNPIVHAQAVAELSDREIACVEASVLGPDLASFHAALTYAGRA